MSEKQSMEDPEVEVFRQSLVSERRRAAPLTIAIILVAVGTLGFFLFILSSSTGRG